MVSLLHRETINEMVGTSLHSAHRDVTLSDRLSLGNSFTQQRTAQQTGINRAPHGYRVSHWNVNSLKPFRAFKIRIIEGNFARHDLTL